VKKIFSILFALVLLLGLGLVTAAPSQTGGPAYAAGAEPMGLAGTVITISPPGPVPAGTLVQAYVGNELRAQTTTDAQGKYVFLVPGPGGTVTFKVAGVTAHESATWVSGELEEGFDLTIDVLPTLYHDVTMAVSPVGTGTATDVTGASPYAQGAIVSIKAVAATGYHFSHWTAAPAVVFGNDNAAETTFTMPAADVNVTANFVVAGPTIWYVVEGGAGAQDGINWNNAFANIQEAIDAASDGDTVIVAAGEYDAFLVIEKTDISIIGAEGATVTTAEVFEDAWVMAAVYTSENIYIEGINFDGTEAGGGAVDAGIVYLDSTGRIADLRVANIFDTELGAGVIIIGDMETSVVDLSVVTVEKSIAGVAIWDAEANLNGCTVIETDAGIVIGWPFGGSDPSTVTIQGSTISDNHGTGIWVCDDSILAAHFNNIVGNSYGVLNDGGETVDATNNWWGYASGPYHKTLNPDGTGDEVSDNVYFEPWLGAGVGPVKTETVTNSTVNAIEEADTQVVVTGTATVTVARYDDNPSGPPPTGLITYEDNPGDDAPSDFLALGKYIDVSATNTTEGTELVIELYYTNAELNKAGIDDESLLQLLWKDGDEWKECSHWGVNTTDITGNYTYSGYMWATINNTTRPSLDDLDETPFGGYKGPTEVGGVCGCFIATAAYGTETAKELEILREFRDAVLLPNSLGAKFVSLYYKTSPPIAGFISRHEVLRTAVRVGLVDPIVKILNWSHDLWSKRASQ
jgi:hypothetical protein